MLDQLTQESFAGYVQTRFELMLEPDQPVSLELTEVTALPNRARQPRQPFSLVFRGPHTPALAQRMYTFVHPQVGTIENLFIVPVGQDEQGRYYQAVFN